ncbi:hypothetical protein HY405_00520 [Candidatus Microgenomates bacterium]|nr:hypothetical protein [Candidatus Microgenomates bacterium]
MYKVKTLIVFLLIFFSSVQPVSAIYDPTSVSNNKFGIHIADTADLEDAARLVNSSGGDWGYVTFVVTETDRDKDRWQKVFNRARRLHLTPIVRVATRPQDSMWEKPNLGQIDGWVDFLNSLNWVIKNRYVVIANEPNHAKEWGGEVSPEEYALYLKTFSQKLKRVSEDFFVLPAGLDASAPNSKETMDEFKFIRAMLTAQPDIFEHIDGWVSHSYPNPNFSGSEHDRGRGSITTYEWELNLLKTLGVVRSLPVFITETGWAHSMNDKTSEFTKTEDIGQKFKVAFEKVWSSPKIVAVTPFILNYQEPPFDIFSWKDKSKNFYQFYYDMQNLAKEKGEPIQITDGEAVTALTPLIQFTDSSYTGILLVKNTGQSIWDKETVALLDQDNTSVEISNLSYETLEPGDSGIIVFKSVTPASSGFVSGSIALSHKGKVFGKGFSFRTFLIRPLQMKIEPIFDKIWSLGP